MEENPAPHVLGELEVIRGRARPEVLAGTVSVPFGEPSERDREMKLRLAPFGCAGAAEQIVFAKTTAFVIERA